MRTVLTEYGSLPDVIATSCSNSLKLKDVDFPVPCGKCLQCQRKRRSEWSLRLEHEFMFSDSAFFITLTYNDISIPRTHEGIPTLHKKHLQNYIKRLRNDHVRYVCKQLKVSKKEVKNVSKPIRYYAVGEYGSKTRRPHYHMILFNYDIANLVPFSNQWKSTTTGRPFGFVDVGTVTGASINYVTKYMFKQFNRKTDLRTPPFSLMSKKPIIGHAYLQNYGVHHIVNETLEIRDQHGKRRRLPKAYLRRLFTDKEDRLELSRKSFEQHYEKKVEQYQNKVEKHYGGKVLGYSNSVQGDYNRQLDTINNNEKL